MGSEMREPTFWTLVSLSGGRRHGYALMEEVRDASEGRVELKVATLYAVLERLQREGLVAADGDEVVDGRLRRYFRMTGLGEQSLAAELERMESAARLARVRLARRPAIAQ
ncbi:PadR family transcriptional regulator [Agromyces sp. H66]|uniref:PadR family transcriptional regulator n=1 Tax=Agromyces sp. H66 TaxID=2529859 RepID=UPI0010AB394F|nr:PadR family transcriptional regulator [Agromyces sp. H66]